MGLDLETGEEEKTHLEQEEEMAAAKKRQVWRNILPSFQPIFHPLI